MKEKALREARLKGILARRNNVKVGDNPYPETDETHWQWMAGYADEALNGKKSQMKGASMT